MQTSIVVVVALCILCGCIGNDVASPEPVTIIRNVTFANNTIDETSCYVMIDGECMDEEIRWK